MIVSELCKLVHIEAHHEHGVVNQRSWTVVAGSGASRASIEKSCGFRFAASRLRHQHVLVAPMRLMTPLLSAPYGYANVNW